jgi:dTDP-4-amino-4,6-dideoxygalactose transaminase
LALACALGAGGASGRAAVRLRPGAAPFHRADRLPEPRKDARRGHERAEGQVHYIPVHQHPYYRHRYGEIELPGAAAYYERCLSLPLYPAMGDDDPPRVVEALAEVLGL